MWNEGCSLRRCLQPNVVQAFEGDLLNWNEFGVRLEFGDIENLENILRAIPVEERERKRGNMRKIWARFVWASNNLNPIHMYPKEVQDRFGVQLATSDAFSSIMEILAKRLDKK